MEYQFRPIINWPGKPTHSQEHARFRKTWSQTIDLLERELLKLLARNIVIEAFFEPSQIRLDGMLRGDAKPKKSGVILSFDSRLGPLRYPCDKFTFWQDNLRAIASSLEALRMVDRYGVTKLGEQYRGWTAIPDLSDPETLIRSFAESDNLSDAVREALRKTHPDAGGKHDDFVSVMQAAEQLGLR